MVPFRQWPDPRLVIDFHLSQRRTLGCSISSMFGSDSVRSHRRRVNETKEHFALCRWLQIVGGGTMTTMLGQAPPQPLDGATGFLPDRNCFLLYQFSSCWSMNEQAPTSAPQKGNSLKHYRPPSAIGFSPFTRRLGRSLPRTYLKTHARPGMSTNGLVCTIPHGLYGVADDHRPRQ